MPSLIPGIKYDIFISYRQKDNKGDRWVSEFVEALKTELASTFKEEISIYFDVNPHDGLLETHDVDASLKEKLKCLVFIPILSRTYCDPKSFAWKNEFEAFVEQASHDQFGLKVTLPDGNIVNRVLPVCIHDLQSDDIRLCESILGDTLKGIDFIYKSTGINRPLRPKEEKPDENLNQTSYRDQINKTALAVKEIILGLKGEPDMPVEGIQERPVREQEDKEKWRLKLSNRSVKLTDPKLLIVTGILAILIIAVLFIWPGLIGRHNLKNLIAKDRRIPIAIMPFQNMTNDTTWNVWQDCIQNILITSLSNLNELKVRQVGTISSILKSKRLTDYASLTPSVAGLISKKLETNVIITGSIKKSGSTLRLNAQLVATKTGESYKSFQIDGTADNILSVIDSLSRMVQDFLLISVLQKEVPNSEHYPVPTKSPDAYRYCIYGGKAFSKLDYTTAIDMFIQALKIDSTIYGLYGGISAAYINQGLYKQAKEWLLKGYSKLDMMDIGDKIWTNYMYTMYLKTPNEGIRYAEEMIDLDDQDPESYYTLGDTYWTMHQYDKAIPEFEKALEIYKKWDSKPDWIINYSELGDSYHGTGQFRKEKKLYKKAEHDFPNDRVLSYNQAILAFTEEDTVAANRYIKKYISLCKDQSWSEARISRNLADVYSKAGNLNKAVELYRKSLSLESGISLRPFTLNKLAYFLIDKDRNIIEGIQLIDKALETNPDNYSYLHTKGWGLYKQGEYEEALKILEKSDSLKPVYDHNLYLHLEAAKKAVAGLN